MAIFFDEPRKWRGSWGFPLLFILLVLLVIAYPDWEIRYRNARVQTMPNPPAFREEPRRVMGVNGIGFRPDVLEGMIFQHRFAQEGSRAGRSPDELSITFAHPIELQGIHVSADCWKDTRLVEFAGGIDQKPAYQTNGNATMFFHATFATTDSAGAIEETFWFPKPFRIEPNQAIRIGAWIQNNSSEQRFVSPEFILYFTGSEMPRIPPNRPRRLQTPPNPQSLPPLPEEEINPRKPPKKPPTE